MANINYGALLGELACGGTPGLGSYLPGYHAPGDVHTARDYGTVPVKIYIYDRATKKVVPGATVKISGVIGGNNNLASGVTGADGSVSLTVPALPDVQAPTGDSSGIPEYSISVQAPGYDWSDAYFYPNWGTSQIISMSISPTGSNFGPISQISLDIYAYDKDSKPIAGATVAIASTGSSASGYSGGMYVEKKTDGSGKLSVKLSSIGQYEYGYKWYSVTITKAGYVPRTLTVFGRISLAISVGMTGAGISSTPPSSGGGGTTPPSSGTPPSRGTTPPSGGGGTTPPSSNTPPAAPVSGGGLTSLLSTTTGKLLVFGGGALAIYLLMKR